MYSRDVFLSDSFILNKKSPLVWSSVMKLLAMASNRGSLRISKSHCQDRKEASPVNKRPNSAPKKRCTDGAQAHLYQDECQHPNQERDSATGDCQIQQSKCDLMLLPSKA